MLANAKLSILVLCVLFIYWRYGAHTLERDLFARESVDLGGSLVN